MGAERIRCLVDGVPFPCQSSFQVRDATDKVSVLHEVDSLSAEHVGDVVKSSQRAFEKWRATDVTERRSVLLKVLNQYRDQMDALVELECRETTTSVGFANFDVKVLALQCLEETICCMSAALRGELAPSTASGKRLTVKREPYGIVFSIVPWNAPVCLAMRGIITPLAAGNAVILKTSEYSPALQAAVVSIFHQAGLPPSLVNVVHVARGAMPEVTRTFVEHKLVRKVNFTGSTHVGRIVSQLCASNDTPVVLELGGKGCVVVLKDADLALAANNIVFGALLNQGQICMATTNVLVHVEVRKELEDRIREIVGNHRLLFRADNSSNYDLGQRAAETAPSQHRLRGVVSSEAARTAKESYEEALSHHGAFAFAGEAAFDVENSLVQPVFLHCTGGEDLFKKELFAPIVGTFAFRTVSEAVQLANDCVSGLSTSIFGQDETQAYLMASQIDSGAVHINGCTVHDDQSVPHGGVRSSGNGRFSGLHGIQEFTYLKTITYNPPHYYDFELM
ncbi:aldehyde dehydrogenase [Acaromyces ingoldii]|uniref:Aldehyde dehydrogenase n=1 Tax=Acaromyces ingoldii TaxID=215250 RepID=A0A316YF94_9BASI|nr:aldehyde dehydrogenase [Acaromyces ingoldii]PWN86733.1 aldehyde dehydrogenase [Acaromyces ingoldii]